jgi:hypothetical protein
MITEPLELASEDVFDGASDDGLTDVDGQGFDRIEIEVEARPFFAVSASGDDLPPPVGHVAKLGQIVGPTLGERHGVLVLELAKKAKSGKLA